MSFVTHPDADAFMRKYLECPTDTAARLVFSDWLEETGEPHSIAWAHFIRLKYEAGLHPLDSPEWRELDRRADECAEQIRARLTISAKLFVGYPKSLLQLLPAPRITVRLANFEVPRPVLELVPESVARENLVLPLDAQEQTLLIAAANPNDFDTAQKLQFILNREVLQIGAERADIQTALDRHYDYEYAAAHGDPPLLLVFEDVAIFPSTSAGDSPDLYSPIVRLVNLILQEAINLRADRIHIFPDGPAVVVRYRIGDEWAERDRIPLRLLRHVVRRIAIMAGIPIEWTFANPPALAPVTGQFPVQVPGAHFSFRVTIQPSPDGPTLQIDLPRGAT
jgi:type IV pilus assembly protein PilB